VGGNLPPDVDEGAYHLNHEGCHQDDADDPRRVAIFHEEEAAEVAEDGDDVRHKSALLSAQFLGSPTLQLAIQMYQQGGHQDGEKIYREQHRQLICHRQKRHIAEHEKRHQSYQGEIEGGEDHAYDASCQYDIFLFHNYTIF
jgi:hypothetical protein